MLKFMHVLKYLAESGLQTLIACWTREIISLFSPDPYKHPEHATYKTDFSLLDKSVYLHSVTSQSFEN